MSNQKKKYLNLNEIRGEDKTRHEKLCNSVPKQKKKVTIKMCGICYWKNNEPPRSKALFQPSEDKIDLSIKCYSQFILHSELREIQCQLPLPQKEK